MDARFEINFLCNHRKCVQCVVSTKLAQRLQTGLRLCNRNATVTSRKWKGSYDSSRKYRSGYERLVCG